MAAPPCRVLSALALGRNMARPSTIAKLAPDVLAKLQELLRDPRISQLEVTQQVNDLLLSLGEQPISKSAVNRYSMRMEKVGEKLRQSREVSKMWINELGAAPQGDVGNLVNEILRTVAFDLSMKLHDIDDPDQMPGVIKMLKELSLSVMRLEVASSENVKREKDIRDQERETAAETAATIARKGGATKETIENIKAGILGVSRD